MKSLLTASTFVSLLSLAPGLRAEPVDLLRSAPVVPLPRALDEHPVPRVKLSLVKFNAGHPSGGTIALESLHLDLYAISRKWVRLGVDVEGGLGHTKLAGASTSLKYALMGASAGVQLPGRITPFIEGRLAAGVLAGTLNDALMIPGTTIEASGLSVATWLWAGGVDVGAEFYTFGRSYLSAAIGWIRTGWRGADYSQETGLLEFKDVTHNSFMFKVGFGF